MGLKLCLLHQPCHGTPRLYPQGSLPRRTLSFTAAKTRATAYQYVCKTPFIQRVQAMVEACIAEKQGNSARTNRLPKDVECT